MGEYEQESWQLSEDEKMEAVPRLREEGNQLYKQKQYAAAADKYAQAIGYLEQLLLRYSSRVALGDWKLLILHYPHFYIKIHIYFPRLLFFSCISFKRCILSLICVVQPHMGF